MDFDAQTRLSDNRNPKYDEQVIHADEAACAKKAQVLASQIQKSNQASFCKQPILSAEEIAPTLGPIDTDTALAAPKPIRVGTDCSGMEAPIQAVENMKVPFDHVLSCDSDPNSKKTIAASWKPDKFYCDITTRDNAISPEVDVYVTGFPCQSFSKAGKQQGFEDEKGRGTIFETSSIT